MDFLHSFFKVLSFLAVLLHVADGKCAEYNSEIVYKWITHEFLWPSEEVKQEYNSTGRYIKENNALNGIKLYNGSVYLTVPRLKTGVAASLVLVVPDGTESPPFQPYPSWDMHVIGDCNTLQLVQSMEIDPNTGYMWILDTAYVPMSGIEVADRCPAKLVVWDLVGNREVLRYVFPTETVGVGLFYLNDLVLDYVGGSVAFVYMSDTLDKKLVVYDALENKSYAFKHQSMDAKPEHKNITISGKSTIAPLGINGIAMSSDFEYVYYTAVSDENLYRIPTSVLRDSNSDDAEFARHYQVVGDKGVQSDGLYAGKNNNLYYSTLGKNGVMKWDISADESKSSDGDSKIQMKTVSDLGMDSQMEWIDSIGMDDDGFLWFTSNNLHEFFGNNTVPGSYNFYVWRSYVGDRSYLYKPEKQKLSMKTCDDSNSKGELMAEIAYNWTTVDLLWPNCSMKREMVSDGSFIPENNIIDGVRVYKDRIFVTIPKLKPGVPVTLAELVKGDARSPSIQPFPSWSWHNSQNCSALQLVQAIEIDPNTGHMWILDTTNAPHASSIRTNPCPPKIVVYDIQNDQVLRNREFPSTLYSGQYFFGDMVLDIANSSNKFVYITDSSGWRLIVYDYENDYFYTFANPSMNADNNHQNISISGDVISVKDQGINGIAISPNFSHVYFSIMSGTKLFQIPTSILRNSNSGSPEFFNNLRIVGDTNSHTDVIYFAKSRLYYTALERNAINVWDIGADADRSKSYSNVTMTTNMTLVQNCQIGWVSSLSIDENKIMWFLSRETRPFYGNDTSLGTYNMRLWKVKVTERGYLDMTKDNNAILGAANLSSSFALSLFALLVFLYTINL